MSDRLSPTEAARLLRQRLEMGAGDLFLDRMTRDEALGLATRGRMGAASGSEAEVSGSAGKPAEESSTGSRTASSGEVPSDAATKPTRGSASHDADAPLPDDYEALRDLALGCTRCRLSEGRTQVVFSDGPRDARLMVVGEAPGANEDRTGLPFVGAAGRLLDLMLASVDLSRERNAYICNVLKCRPPGNRDPLPDEIDSCAPWLRRQIELVRPEVVLGVGSFAARWLTGSQSPLGKLRGSVYSYQGVPVVVTYHPAALLRNAGWTRATWDDLQLLRQIMDGA